MSYRCLMIVNPARIRCKNEQLLIETEEVHSVPIEDISAIVLESRQSTITTAAMAALAQNGVVTFWCDETHLPCGISLPFAQHSRQLGVLRWQMELTLPAKKRMWQQVVVELPVERRRGQRDVVCKILEHRKMVVLCALRVVRADSDALAAVDAALARDDRLAVPHADRLGRAALDAVRAADALALIQRDRVEKDSHRLRLLIHSVIAAYGFVLCA